MTTLTSTTISEDGQFIQLQSNFFKSELCHFLLDNGIRTIIAPSGLISIIGTTPNVLEMRSKVVKILIEFTADKNIF